MGYYTDYVISAQPTEALSQVLAALSKTAENYFEDIDVVPADDVKYELQNVKWYDHEIHCIIASKNLPNHIMIRLYGIGEVNGDMWVKYFSNGVMKEYRPEMWDPPDFPTDW